MCTNNLADPILMQVPLIKNPLYQPPRAITLNTNYNKLLPTLSTSVIPPKVNLTGQTIQEWKNDIETIKNDKFDLTRNAKIIDDFNNWVKEKQLRVAPGYDYSPGRVMVPGRVEKPHAEVLDTIKELDPVNELDVVFGKTQISE